MNLIQFAHGILVEAEDAANCVTQALPSFNPLPEELHANPVACDQPQAEWTPPTDPAVKAEHTPDPAAVKKPVADEFLKDEAKKD